MSDPYLTISAVERETGLSKDVLRMWERRYGFPLPERDEHGERIYPPAQVDRLRLIKRLMDVGYRPGKLIAASDEELARLAPRRSSAGHASPASNADLDELLGRLKANDATGFQQAMHRRLARHGLERFVLETVAPLTHQVGAAWENGDFEVFEEHLFTELTKRVLRQAIETLPPVHQGPRILLTSLPEEQHILGLLMAEALFALEGAVCIPLGTQMPLLDIGRAAAVHGADIVALSFSQAFPQRQIAGLLQQLRLCLPSGIELWVGGAGIGRLAPLPGVRTLRALEEIAAALKDWQQATPQQLRPA